MRNSLIFSFLLIFLASCNGLTDDGQTQDLKDQDKNQNLPPKTFKVFVDSVTFKKADLRWEEAEDPEGFKNYYSIYLGDSLIILKTPDTSFELKNLKELTTYKGKVTAEDPQGNSISVPFEFTTKKNYQTFLKFIDFRLDRECVAGFTQSFFKAPDGNYFIVGKTSKNGSNFFNYVAKVDPIGNLIWSKTYPYENGDLWEIRANLTKTGLVLMSNYYVLKLDFDGKEIWAKRIARFDVGVSGVEIKDIVEAKNEEIYLIGDLTSDNPAIRHKGILMKLSPSGEVVWEKFMDQNLSASLSRIILTAENDLIILGAIGTKVCTGTSIGEFECEQTDAFLLRLTLEGEVKWKKTYGDSNYDFPETIIQLKNGNIVFGGNSVNRSQGYSARIFETSPNGDLIWEHKDPFAFFSSIKETHDQGLITIGRSDGYSYLPKIGLIKFAENRSLEWRKEIGESTTGYYARDILVESDQGYRIAGFMQNNLPFDCDEKLIFLKTDPLGFFEPYAKNE